MNSTEANFYKKQKDDNVICYLCPHYCKIGKDNKGICGVRTNKEGELFSDVYGKVSALNIDPIEKKPLYHFHPGENILSIGSIGCNLKCKFCQNYDISQLRPGIEKRLHDITPENIVTSCKTNNSFGIAYTYNEPTVWYEYMIDTARLAQKNGLKNIVVSNGYINEKPLEQLLKYIDAFNIDLKAFNDDFYKKYASAKLEPVKKTLISIKKSGKHLEITNLVIPGLNDDERSFRDMIDWISSDLGKDTVLHLSRYYPTFKMTIQGTPVETLNKLFDIAKSQLNHVYLGNIHNKKGNDTFCSNCGNVLVKRSGYFTDIVGIDEFGKCLVCGKINIKTN